LSLPVPYLQQEQRHTCGIACLRMAAHYFGGQHTETAVTVSADISPVLGMTCRAIASAAITLGYGASVATGIAWQRVADSLAADRLIIALLDPHVLYLGGTGLGHFVIIIGLDSNDVIFHDPMVGDNIRISRARFEAAWTWSNFEGVIIRATS